MLKDKFGRTINYLRLAVTDRCNLRCFYCMPEEGIQYIDRKELLAYEELLRLVRILIPEGINKVRITGGEPFIRKDLMAFLRTLNQENDSLSINLTTNGVLTSKYLPDLKQIGIEKINFSLDSIDPDRFFTITKRKVFDQVWNSILHSLSLNIETKINAVVMEGKNINDILPLARLSLKYPLGIRYIEEMPFNGGNHHFGTLTWNHDKILNHLKQEFPNLMRIPAEANSTSAVYQIPGAKGTIGIIAAYSRTFCGSCNRIRITPQGVIKTCLYDQGVFDIKSLLRAGGNDRQILEAIQQAVQNKAEDGFAAEMLRDKSDPFSESMATIGG